MNLYDQIIKTFRETADIDATAAIHKCTTRTVYRACKSVDVKLIRHLHSAAQNSGIEPSTKWMIETLIESGFDIDFIPKCLGVSKRYLNKVIHETAAA